MAKVSAGILMFKKTDKGLEVLLEHPGGPLYKATRNEQWAIPKGERDNDQDTLFEVARREFLEETNITVPDEETLFISLGEVIQSHNGKHVNVWAYQGDLPENYEFKSNTFQMEWPPHSGQIQEFPESEDVKFFPISEARAVIWPSQLEFLDRLEAALQ